MHSPLPDSSALEAGIIEDARPTRISRVLEDSVRNLLRASVFASPARSPTTPTRQLRVVNDTLPMPASSPLRPQAQPTISHGVDLPPVLRQAFPEVLLSPASPDSRTATTTTPATVDVADFPQPPESYHGRIQRMAQQSAMFNTRAMEALNHPDLSDPSLEDLSQQKTEHRQRKSCKRPRRSRKAAQRAAASRGAVSVLTALLLAALVATYVSIATTVPGLTPTFHILFVLGICLATILFAHSVIRLFLTRRWVHNQPLFVAVPRHGHHHHRTTRHRHHPYQQRRAREMPTLSGEAVAFVPPTPIPVHVSTDDVREDPHVAEPSIATQVEPQTWNKEVSNLPNPPPAYGRWRGSVRADPDLLHWQALPSPSSPETPVLPSPTYEEAVAMAHNESPPSYMTRESPARQREMQEARAGLARLETVEPEMVEVRAVGVGLAA